MTQLHTACRAPVKVFRTFEKGFHNTTVTCGGYFDVIGDFMKKHVLND